MRLPLSYPRKDKIAVRRKQKRLLWVFSIFCLGCGLCGCKAIEKIASPIIKIERAPILAPLPAYSGPRSKVAVADFDVKAAKASSEIGAGLREMFVSALLNSNRFLVTERQDPTDFIISITLAEFEPQASGGRSGVGGGGGISSGEFGGLLGATLNKAHLALDVRIIDGATTKVLASNRLQGQAQDTTGAIMGGSWSNWKLGSSLSNYANTSMEKAIRICIIETVRYISGAIPGSYYKYN